MTTKTNKEISLIDEINKHIVEKKLNTSQAIRYVYSKTSGDRRVSQTEQLLKQTAVRTKNGDFIRYQHVRGIMSQTLGAKV